MINQKHKKHYCIEPNCNNIVCQANRRCRSCATKNQLKDPRNHPMFGKLAPHIKGNYYKNIYMRSFWEVLFAQFLDLNGYKWEYEPKVFDLGNCTYRPDFYITEWDLYIEIKGWFKTDAKKKIKLFRKLYPKLKLQILMKKSLKELGIY